MDQNSTQLSAAKLLWLMTIDTNDLIVSHYLNRFPFLPVQEQVKRNNLPNYKSSIQCVTAKPTSEKPQINATV